MSKFDIQDPSTGKIVTLEGDSAPTEQELEQIFGGSNGQDGQKADDNPSPNHELLKGQVEQDVYNPEETKKNAWWHPLLNVLPIGGAIAGSVAGGGVASIPLAAIGAAGGEGWKQSIEELTGQRDKADPLEIAKQGISGAAGEGTGQIAGKALEGLLPVLGSIADISGNAYNDVFQNADKLPVTRTLMNPILKYFGQGMDSSITGKEVGKEIENLKPLPKFSGKDIDKAIKDIVNKTDYDGVNPTANSVGAVLKRLYRDLGDSNIIQSGNNLDTSMLRPEDAEAIQGVFGNPKLPEGSKISPLKLHGIKNGLKSDIGWTKDAKAKKEGQALLKQIYGGVFKKKLAEVSPAYNEAMNAHSLAKSAEEFKNFFPRGNHQKARVAAEIGIAPAALAAGHYFNPILSPFAAASALFSPRFHGTAMSAYELAAKSKIGSAIGSGLEQIMSPEERAYQEAVKKRITPDGSIPAEQYKKERGL